MIPQAVILLGGKGTRLAADYPDLPKCLVPVSGRPFLEWQLDWLRRNGIGRVLLAGGHKADVLERYLLARPADGLVLALSREPEPRGTGGALKFVEKLLAADPVLVVNGDTLVPRLELPPAAAARRRTDAEAAAGFSTLWKTVFHGVEKPAGLFHGVEKSFPHCGKIFVAPIADPGRYGTVELGEDGFVAAFREKAERTAGFVNAGLYWLPAALIAAIPADRPVSLETEIFPALAAERRLVALPAPPPLLDMGTPDGLNAMEHYLRG